MHLRSHEVTAGGKQSNFPLPFAVYYPSIHSLLKTFSLLPVAVVGLNKMPDQCGRVQHTAWHVINAQ